MENPEIMYQPVYLDNKGNIISIGKVVFPTKIRALEFGNFVCKNGNHVKILELELM